MSLVDQQLEVREHLVAALGYDLVGPMRDDEVLASRPSRTYLTGFLVPLEAPAEHRADPLVEEDVAPAMGEEGAEDTPSEGAAPSRKTFFPSSAGLSVLVPAEATHLQVSAEWGRYGRLSLDESAELWANRPAPRRPDSVATDATSGDEPGDDDPEHDGRRLWQRLAVAVGPMPVPLHDGAHWLPDTPDLEVVVRCKDAIAPGLPAGTRAVSVFVVNRRRPGETRAETDEATLFQFRLSLRCDAGFQARFDGSGERSEDPDERRTDLQYRDFGEWAVGHGTSTEASDPDDSGTVREVATCWLPTSRVYRMKATDVPGVDLSMSALAELADAEELLVGIEPLLAGYTQWITDRRLELADLSDRRSDWGETLLRAAERARSRIRQGIEYLGREPLALEAFRLANRAMADSSRKARPDDPDPKWRLFQLAFFLLSLESTAEPAHDDRETVELLFFPTGGGKTEAYFGVAAFAMALRRLRGQGEAHGGAGVSVLLRYTLRLLTLDQLQRAATLTCAMERLRLAQPERLGSRRFSIGLWVGLSATPNKLQAAEKQVRAHKNHPDDPYRPGPLPLAWCPWCGTPFRPECYEIDKVGKKVHRLLVGCADYNCDFSFDKNDDGLPLVVVDEQVYRELPTFLIGTVDKFALLPWRGQGGALFGRVKAQDGRGFYGHDERAPGNASKLKRGLLPPDLIIQDELHLITGPLGTMVGLYETAVGHLAANSEGWGPKIVASTATARRATQQIRALYGRHQVDFFPPQGLTPNETFFATEDVVEGKSRLYLGVAAPGRSVKATMVRVYSTLLAASYKDWFVASAGKKLLGDKNPADTYCTLAAYFNTLRELGGAQRLVLEEVAPRAFELERRHPVQDALPPWFKNRRLGFDVLELTSRQSTDQIRKAKAQLEAPYRSDEGGRNDVLLASSMISVGVDIPRLGLMVMNGQPRTTAEYIQATSRVGRNTPGLVVPVHNLYRPRDRSHYERFAAYHEGFYRSVEAASVTPFSSRAIDRALAAVSVTLARHGAKRLAPPRGVEQIDDEPSLAAQIAAVIAARVSAHRLRDDSDLAEEVRNRVIDLFDDWSQIVAGLKNVAVPFSYCSWETSTPETLLRTAVDPPSQAEPERLRRFVSPTSMRDVEPSVHLWVKNTLGEG